MELKNFLSEFEGLSDERLKIAERIKSHKLPVIIFGAARMAKLVTDELKKFDIDVAGYAVDAKYFEPNQIYLGKPVYNFDELSLKPDKYVFVLGVGSKLKHGKRAIEFMNSDKYIHYSFGVLGNEYHLETIDYSYISEHATEFIATYNLLNDDFSRNAMMAYLKSQTISNTSYVDNFFSFDQYFNELTLSAIKTGGVRGLRRVYRRYNRRIR